jgi:hypothetical protein
MRMLREEKGRRKPLHAPSHATPGGKTTKTRKKEKKNTETPPPPRQVKKSKTAAGINGQKPKTPPGRQASGRVRPTASKQNHGSNLAGSRND